MGKKEKLTVQRLFFDGQELRTEAFIQGGDNQERSFSLAKKHAEKIAAEDGYEVPDNAVFVRSLAESSFSWNWWILWSPEGKDIMRVVRSELPKQRYAVLKRKSEIKDDE